MYMGVVFFMILLFFVAGIVFLMNLQYMMCLDVCSSWHSSSLVVGMYLSIVVLAFCLAWFTTDSRYCLFHCLALKYRIWVFFVLLLGRVGYGGSIIIMRLFFPVVLSWVRYSSAFACMNCLGLVTQFHLTMSMPVMFRFGHFS